MLAQGVETTTRCTTAWSSHAFWNQQFASCRPIMKNSSSSAPSLPATTSKTTKPSNGAGWNSPGRYDLLLHAAASHGLRSPAPSSAAAAAEASADAARALRKRKREEEATEDDEEEPIVITMAPAAAQLRAGAATASGQAVITIPRTYTHETASNLFVFAELTGARKRDIALSFDEGTLRLMASRQPSLAPASDGEGGWEEGANYMVTMPLPPWVDDRRMRCVKITFSTGLLELCIPKDLAHHDEEEYPVAAAAAGAPPINAVVTVSGIGAGLTSSGREQRWRPSGHQVDQATLTAAEPAAGFLFPAHAASAYAEAVGHSTPPTERRVH